MAGALARQDGSGHGAVPQAFLVLEGAHLERLQSRRQGHHRILVRFRPEVVAAHERGDGLALLVALVLAHSSASSHSASDMKWKEGPRRGR